MPVTQNQRSKEGNVEAETLDFTLTGLTVDDVETDLQKVWADLQSEIRSDPEILKLLKEKKIPVEAVAGKPVTDLIRIKRTNKAGFTGLETFAVQLLSAIAVQLFKEFILPQLKRGKNAEAIRPSKSE